MMTPKAVANHTPSLSSDVPDDKMHAPYLGVHVRRAFCLFGHVTDGYTSSTSPVTLQKLNVASAPYTTIDEPDFTYIYIYSPQYVKSGSSMSSVYCLVTPDREGIDYRCIILWGYIYIYII